MHSRHIILIKHLPTQNSYSGLHLSQPMTEQELHHLSSIKHKVRYINSVHSLSHVWLFATPWTAAQQASLSITKSQSLVKHVCIESVMPYNHLSLYRPLLPLTLIFPSFTDFSSELVLCTKRPKFWSFSFIISPTNGYSGPISFRIDWLDLLAVQETLKSLLQHHSSKASILQHSAEELWYNSHMHTWLLEKQ